MSYIKKKIIKNITNLDYVNNRIKKEICYTTLDKLKDENLLDEYKKCNSVKKEIKNLESILIKYDIDVKIRDSIINDYILKLIPPGTKGVVRGNKFNNIVKNTIENLKLNTERFEICFEKKCELCLTPEIPDWYILDKKTNKVIIGMNQLDLWGGGQQINRGFKYLVDNKINCDKSKLLCVVCNEITFVSSKNKAFKLFEIGYKTDTLCYIKNIETIIKNYFD